MSIIYVTFGYNLAYLGYIIHTVYLILSLPYDIFLCILLSFYRAVALEGLKSLKEALEEYKAVLKLSPTLADASKAVNRLSSALGIPLPPKPSSSNSGKQSNTNNSVGGLTEEDARVLEEAEHRVKEVGRQKARTQQQLSMSNAEKRRSELTLSQLGTIPNDRNLYRSVGRLFIKTPKPEIETLLQTAAQKADQKMKVCSSTMEYLQKQEAEADKAFLEVIESIRKKAGRT